MPGGKVIGGIWYPDDLLSGAMFSTPGANAGPISPQQQQQVEEIDQQQAEVLEQSTQAVEGETSQQQKLNEAQVAAEIAAKKARKKAELANLDAEEASAKAGIPTAVDPTTGQPVPPMSPGDEALALLGHQPGVFTEAPAALEGRPPVQQSQVAPGGIEPVVDHLAAPGIAAAASERDALTAESRLKASQTKADILSTLQAADAEDEEADRQLKELEDLNREREAQREKIRVGIDELTKKQIKPPKPSVANLIGAFLGGLVAPYYGGRNPILELVERRLNAEAEAEVETRRSRMEGFRGMRQAINEQEAADDRTRVAKNVAHAAKLQSFAQELRNKAALPFVDEAQRVEALKIAAQYDTKAAALKLDAAKIAFAQFDRIANRDLQREQIAARMAAKRGTKGGVSTKPTGQELASNMFFGWHGRPIDPNDSTTWPKDVSFEDIGKQVVGNLTVKTPHGNFSGIFANDADSAKNARDRIDNYLLVRQKGAALLAEFQKLQEQGEVLEGLSVAGLQSKSGGNVSRAFTEFRVAIKELWGLGAIQKPDERLMDGATGADPTGITGVAASKLDASTVRNMAEGFLASSEDDLLLRMRPLLLGGGADPNIKIQVNKAPVAEFVQRRGDKQRSETAEDIAGNVEATLRGIKTGETTRQDLQEQLRSFQKAYRAGQRESGSVESGDEVATGASVSQLRKARKSAEKAERRMIDRALNDMYWEFPDAVQVGVVPPNYKNIILKAELKALADAKKLGFKGLPSGASKELDREKILSEFRKSAGYRETINTLFNRERDKLDK